MFPPKKPDVLSPVGAVEAVVLSISRLMSTLDHCQRIIYLRQQVIPRYLYKFRAALPDSYRSMEDILVHSKLWLSSPTDFNDPFDMAAKIIVDSTGPERRKRFDEILKSRGLSWTERQRELPRLMAQPLPELEKLAQQKFQERTDKTGVCSFAGDPLNILMWSHYASNHHGVCLQFDVASDPINLLLALPVEYNDEYPVVNWITGFGGSIAKTLLRKSVGWSYERERRIVVLEMARQSYEFLPEALTSIIIGCRADEKPIFELLDQRQSKGLPSPRLYRSVQHDRKYKLILEAVAR
jgi:hypothetical protein